VQMNHCVGFIRRGSSQAGASKHGAANDGQECPSYFQ
jgi:hypothetical protein